MNFFIYESLCLFGQLAGIGRYGICILQGIHHMREFARVEGGAFNVVSSNGDDTGNAQILPGIRADEASHRKEVGMDHIERFALVFFDDQLEPIDKRIIHAFVRAEAGHVDSV